MSKSLIILLTTAATLCGLGARMLPRYEVDGIQPSMDSGTTYQDSYKPHHSENNYERMENNVNIEDEDGSIDIFDNKILPYKRFTTVDETDFKNDQDDLEPEPENLIQYSQNIESHVDDIRLRRSSKRGLSMLARWRPFSSLGRQRNPIRSGISRSDLLGSTGGFVPEASDFDIVSAETRAMLRPVGQPLRWG